MNKNITDVIIHTKEPLTTHQFDEVSKNVTMKYGVISLSRNANTPQCLMLIYHSGKTRARNILNVVTNTGVKASLVGI
jgi:hypothetical protein